MSLSILVNHLGYDTGAPKRAVIALKAGQTAVDRFRVLREADGASVHEGPAGRATPVGGWFGGKVSYSVCDFSSVDAPGFYHVSAGGESSSRFEIGRSLVFETTIEPLLRYFRGQRCRGAYDIADREARFFGGRTDRVD